jgi:hypothetical protein
MRKLILIALAGIAIMLAAPEFAAATPAMPGLGATADTMSNVDQVWHRRWHRRWHRHCWHRRHWSGRRCSW